MKQYKTELSPFQRWFVTFIEEKGFDLSEFVDCKDGQIQLGDVLTAIMAAPIGEQIGIKDSLVRIDFKNGDCLDYFKFLAKALTKKDKVGI